MTASPSFVQKGDSMPSSSPEAPELALNRRDFMAAAAGLAAAPFAGAAAGSGGDAPNILFILTDQERLLPPGRVAAGFEPAHARAQTDAPGITFVQPPHQFLRLHAIAFGDLHRASHIQQTRMFDNTNFPWIDSMSTECRPSATCCARPATTPPTRASGT
jgi:hypothetical protein